MVESASKVKKVAILSPDIRLVVFQFLIKKELVPEVILTKRSSAERVEYPESGELALESTQRVFLLNSLDGICSITGEGPYELVDSWREFYEMDWRLSQVRYVFCHKEHVRSDKLYPEFVAKRDELIDSLVNLMAENIWATMAHLNPYFENKNRTGHRVLMFDCNSRASIVDAAGAPLMVFEGGRDPVTNQGIGPKVPLSSLASRLSVADGVVQFEPR